MGRPDLAQKSANLTQDQLAGMLYESLRSKIMPLADDVTVYPAHGAGSACGKNMMKETVDTLKNQKVYNYALNGKFNKEDFVKELTENLPEPPAYFPLILTFAIAVKLPKSIKIFSSLDKDFNVNLFE